MIFTKHSSYVKPLKVRLAAVPFVFQVLQLVQVNDFEPLKHDVIEQLMYNKNVHH